jgi:hypothetical protein
MFMALACICARISGELTIVYPSIVGCVMMKISCAIARAMCMSRVSSHGFGRIHNGAEVTELSTNIQHTLILVCYWSDVRFSARSVLCTSRGGYPVDDDYVVGMSVSVLLDCKVRVAQVWMLDRVSRRAEVTRP